METMTNRQVETIKSLIADRVIDEQNNMRVEILRDYIRSGKPVPRSAASHVIACLLKAPRKTATSTVAETGVYRLADGRIVSVYDSRNNPGRRYGKVWDEDAQTWLYVPGAAYKAAGLPRLSVEEIAAFGKVTVQCAICCRSLTKPESRARGIGPVCASRY